ncbi:putative LPS assembly protein LptD [Salisaeta longa]|uniref:putative LPS assembly protein LptD n=1 Tax=Salisaeta longa TaxID=503170 RepID=UPI0012FC9591|nr:putative LPS assembly protein LptD [Salisaeta longa]
MRTRLRDLLLGVGIVGVLLGLWPAVVHAQQAPDTTRAAARDTLQAPPDSAAVGPDSLRPTQVRPDSLRPDSLQPGGPSAADRRRQAAQQAMSGGGMPADTSQGGMQPVDLTARDSLVLRFNQPSGDTGTLYGNAQMKHADASLKARRITMDFSSDVVTATGAPSDSTGPGSGRGPVFQQDGRQGQTFTGTGLSFNLQTRRGRVTDARTQKQGGFVQGRVVKAYEDSTVFVRDGSYTTCDCGPNETPSYSLRSSRMKVKGKWVYTGPIQLYLFNVPTPLWLPFGFLPAIPGRRSGPLPPQYGEDNKGLYLRDWGWYFAISDYMDLQLRFGIWSQGSWEVNPIYRYAKRYRYNGGVDLNVVRTKIGEPQDPGFRKTLRGGLRWNHNQELSPTASLGANVNLVTSEQFLRQDQQDYGDVISREISSSINYNKNWRGSNQSLSINASQQQNLNTGTASLSFPNVRFSQGSFRPFKREDAVGEERWYEKIRTSYSGDLSNRYQFTPTDSTDIQWYEALVSPTKYRRATGNSEPFDFEATHRIPINASFRVNKYNLNITPQFSYNSTWLIRTTRRALRLDTTRVGPDSIRVEQNVVERSVPGFFADRQFSTGLSVSTEAFGLFPIAVGAFEGLRHRVQPSLSFNFQPNFNDPFWGSTRTAVVDTQGTVRRYDIATGRFVAGSTEQRSLGFSLGNDFETKRIRIDSTGQRREETIKLLDADLNTGYNFAADSLKLSDIRLNLRTGFLDEFNVRSSLSFSPYAISPDSSTIINTYLAARNPLKPLRLTRATVSFGGSFGGGGNRGSQQMAGGPGASFGRQGGRGRQGGGRGGSTSDAASSYANNRSGYPSFRIPWQAQVNFSYRYNRRLYDVNQNAEVSGSVRLSPTPLWDVNITTGFDFVQQELALTRININRDLGCWNMSFNWTPFGRFQSFGFTLQVNGGQLSNLLRLNLPRAGNPLSGFGSQLRQSAGGFGGGGGYY